MGVLVYSWKNVCQLILLLFHRILVEMLHFFFLWCGDMYNVLFGCFWQKYSSWELRISIYKALCPQLVHLSPYCFGLLRILIRLVSAIIIRIMTHSDVPSQSVWRPLFLITKTRLYSFDPLKPHFYIVKLGFTWVYIIFLISAQKHRLWVLVRTASPRWF